jgi:EmrB/QacA subfamily drug resistance transporter
MVSRADSLQMTVIGKKERRILILATLASFFVPYLTSSITVALPVIGREFSLDAVFLGWVMSSYILSTAICIVPLGRIADIYGRKRLFILGIIFLTAGCLLSIFAWSAWSLIIFRVIQGAGGAMIFSTSVAILTAVFPAERRGWALGITLASVYGGLSVGPFIGGILTEYLGWRSIFLVIVPPGLAVLWITLRSVKEEWTDARGESFDLKGSILYAISLFGIMYGITLVPDPLSGVWILTGGVLLVIFLWWESRCMSPIIDLGVFRYNMTFTFSNLAALINYASTYAIAFLLSLYLQYTKDLSPQAAGAVLVAQPFVQTILSPSAGRLSDRIEPRVVASAGMTLTAIGLLLFSFLTKDTSISSIVLTLILMGFGYALFSSPNTNAIMSSVVSRHYGVASSMVATMRAIGQLASMAIVMMILSLVMGRVEVTPEVYPQFLSSVQVSFLLLFILSVLGVFASLVRGTIRNIPPVG